MAEKPERNILLYDGECPFCTTLSKYYALKEALPGLQLVSMRDTEGLSQLHLPPELDFEKGMILLRTDGPILQGEPAFALINRLVNKTTLWDRIVIGANSSRPVSRILYPLAYLGRKIDLR